MEISLDGKMHTEKAVLALGMFDGVHVGHQVLLRRAKALANQRHVPLVASTFTTHPMALIHPEKMPPMLTTLDERARRMEALGADILHAQPFDKRMMNSPPEEYIAKLYRQFHPVFMVVGYNHTFGKKGQGNPELLRALGQALGFGVEVVPPITLDGEEVSASEIRGLLARGQVTKARALLGGAYQRQATVASRIPDGYRLHLSPNGKQDVPAGVYWIALDAMGKRYPATVRMERESIGLLRLPVDFSLGDEVVLHYYREVAG